MVARMKGVRAAVRAGAAHTEAPFEDITGSCRLTPCTPHFTGVRCAVRAGAAPQLLRIDHHTEAPSDNHHIQRPLLITSRGPISQVYAQLCALERRVDSVGKRKRLEMDLAGAGADVARVLQVPSGQLCHLQNKYGLVNGLWTSKRVNMD